MVSAVVVVGKEEGWAMYVVLPAAVVGALIVGAILYLSVPKKRELVEEIR